MLRKTALALLVSATACLGIPPEGRKPVLANHVEDWRDEVIYQVIIDRFANGDVNNDYNIKPGALARYQGGDWKGVEDHLDYLEELGVTTVWISPVVRNIETDADFDAYHGYWQQDLLDVNPHFGDLPALRSLTAALHARKMKIVLDVVTNHMGQVFFYDQNLNGKPDVYISGTGTPNVGTGGGPTSPVTRITEYDPDFDIRGIQAFTSLGPAGRAPIIFINDPSINRVPPRPEIFARREAYHGLGRILDYEKPEQNELGDFPGGLKDVATENPQVREAMIDVFARWAEEVDFDGFRIDTVKHVEHDFWKVFSAGVRARLHRQGKTNWFMFGEAFDGRDKLLGSYTQKGELDSVFYFSQKFQVYRDVFAMAHDEKAQAGTQNIVNLWNDRTVNYGTEKQDLGANVAPHKALVGFLDNHDVARFLYDAKGDTEAMRNGLTLLMTSDQIPCIYYGTEQDFAGGNDPANREVLWDTGFPRTGDTYRHLAKLGRLRKAYLALRRGDLAVKFATTHTGAEDDAGMFAFERTGGDAGDRYALVVQNTNARHPSSAALTGVRPGLLVDVLDPQQPQYQVDAQGNLRVTVPAQRAMILVPSDQYVQLR